MEEEIWLPINGFEGLYEISSYGNVKSFARVKNGKLMCHAVRPIYKYHTIVLTRDGIHFGHYIHTLVLEHFKELRPDGLECLHDDGDPENNYIGNLRWGTHKENVQDSMRHGTFNLMIGENHIHAKLRESDILEIRKLLSDGECQKLIAKKFGICQQQVSRINIGKRWMHTKNILKL